ncbi:hypothetical protein [Alteribacter populi]|uniref:hypothetical protein n=1 Tax=Alteribacter populi TaxID=2011011 RepID=UPI000BBB00A0|nr:hypothetical protein [Alteribacter populi]
MKKKVASSALALTVLFGGATYSSTTVSASDIEEKSIYTTKVHVQDEYEPQVWAALGRAAVSGLGFAIGYNAASGPSSNDDVYDYEDVKKAFDQ